MVVVKIFFMAVSGLFVLSLAVVVVGIFLVLTGSPEVCAAGPNSTRVGDQILPSPSTVLARQLDRNWEDFSFDSEIRTVTLWITEAEASSKAREHVIDEDIPVDDIRIYFCDDGTGQIAGRVEALGVDAEFVVTGSLDVSGDRPVLTIDSIDIGRVPDFVSDAVFDVILNEGDRTLELDENLTEVRISDGLIRITGRP